MTITNYNIIKVGSLDRSFCLFRNKDNCRQSLKRSNSSNDLLRVIYRSDLVSSSGSNSSSSSNSSSNSNSSNECQFNK